MNFHNQEEKFEIYSVAIIKFIKTFFLLIVSIGLFKLSNMDTSFVAESVLDWLHVDVEGHLWIRIMDYADRITPTNEILFGSGFFAYALLNIAQGVGILLRKKWAAIVIISEDFILIPIEIYELFKHFHWTVLLIFIINVWIAVIILRDWVVFKSFEPSQNDQIH